MFPLHSENESARPSDWKGHKKPGYAPEFSTELQARLKRIVILAPENISSNSAMKIFQSVAMAVLLFASFAAVSHACSKTTTTPAPTVLHSNVHFSGGSHTHAKTRKHTIQNPVLGCSKFEFVTTILFSQVQPVLMIFPSELCER